MEDLDFVERLSKKGELLRIHLTLYTSGRRWKQSNIICQAWRNAKLRKRWRNGEITSDLAKEYYKEE